MDDFDLLTTVQPEKGWFAILGIKNKKNVKQRLVATREELDNIALEFVKEKRNVFFGLAKYITGDNRTQLNVHGLKAFWLDIDCGDAKTAINETTGKPFGYIDQEAGGEALYNFCVAVGLPKPIIVNSGRGLHVYWALTQEVSSEQWQPVADRLRELCVTHDLYVDGAVFETARVLRVPGTYNFKDDPPTRVEVVSPQDTPPTPIEYKEFSSLLGVVEKEVPLTLDYLSNSSLFQNTVSQFSKIMLRSAEGDGCAQLLDCFLNQDTLVEPRWFDALSVANKCEDRESAIIKMSENYPDYSFEAADAKAHNAGGPHSCGIFERNNPGGCEGCPHKGKITGPIQLGNEIAHATEEDNLNSGIPTKYPFPFFRPKGGGIYALPKEEEAEPEQIYEHDLYVHKRMRDPVLGDVVVMKLHMPRDGVKEFTVSNAQIMDKNEIRKKLASEGVMCGTKKFTRLIEYIQAVISDLQHSKRAEQMRTQFGWADANSRFIIGDREISRDGTYHSPPSSITTAMADHMRPQGTLEKWKEVFSLYGQPGLEPHAFAALTAFGSPLLKFLGQNGAIINLIHPSSGTGKTTVLHMCNSVMGNPEALCANWSDTLNAKLMRLGIYNNIAFAVDEMTNITPAEFSTLVYSMSQGRGKDRLKSQGNELRANLTSWQSVSLCSSNASFYEKMASAKNAPDGEMMRLLEYKIDFTPSIGADIAKDMFDHQLRENYGHAGPIYVEWLVNNLEEAKDTAIDVQRKIDNELKLTQRERFWSAVLAANITGGLIAHRLGLLDWELKPIYKWATNMVTELRGDVTPPTTNAASVIGDYVNRHAQNILVVNDNLDLRSNLESLPDATPRGELLIRYEPDTKKMFLAAKAFKNDCVKYQANYKDTLQQLAAKGYFIGTLNKRLSKGMNFDSPGVHTLVFDCSGSELQMEGIVMPKVTNESGED
jgi:hypothetical protein|tara:strand:- start:223 stop:3033 length:2811 start_codon:yes stop_codon:yes gene_type:complete